MAKLILASYGKASSNWAKDEFDVYAKRLRALVDFEAYQFKESRRDDQVSRLREEADSFEKRFPKKDYLRVLLSEEGKLMHTASFAQWLAPKLSQSIVFAIGSAYGFHSDLRAGADLLWSLSPLTFTHEHARILLAEQLYRAIQVTRGHPYHHE